MRAAFQLYRHASQAVAGNFLRTLGFNPLRATADATYFAAGIDPILATARKQQLRLTLPQLVDHLRTVVDGSDAAALLTPQVNVPDDLWQASMGVTAGILLYRPAIRTIAVAVLYHIWENLGTGLPPPRPFANADFFATKHN